MIAARSRPRGITWVRAAGPRDASRRDRSRDPDGRHPAHPDGLQPGLRGADRGRGDLGRRARVSTAGVEERARDPDRDDRHPGRDIRGDHLPGPPVRDRAPMEPDNPLGYETVVSQIARHDLRRRHPRLLLHPVRHAGDLGPGREYRLLRLPAPLLLPGPRPLPAEAVHLSRRSAGLLDRHRDAGHPLLADAGRLRRRDDAHDPALRRRRLHRVHALPGRHGDALAALAGAGLAERAWRSTSSAW